MRNTNREVILSPLESKAFTRWGRQRLHVAQCGHAVHLACWDTYFASLLDRAMSNQVRFLRGKERVGKWEGKVNC